MEMTAMKRMIRNDCFLNAVVSFISAAYCVSAIRSNSCIRPLIRMFSSRFRHCKLSEYDASLFR